jgi:hypothetical protein
MIRRKQIKRYRAGGQGSSLDQNKSIFPKKEINDKMKNKLTRGQLMAYANPLK